MIESPPSPLLLGLLCVLGIAALVALVRAMLRMLRAARLSSLPLVPEQTVHFAEAGRVLLCLEGPRFAPRNRKLQFSLRPRGGAPLVGKFILFRMVTSGVAHARITLRRYDLAHPGDYQLSIDGIDAREATRHQVVLMRPHVARSVLLVVGMVAAAGLALTSLVLLLLSVLPAAQAIDPGTANGYVDAQGQRIELTHAAAQLRKASATSGPSELRITLTDREVPQSALAGPGPAALLELARAGEARGLLLRLDPDVEAKTARLTLLGPPASSAGAAAQCQSDEATCIVRLKTIRISRVRVGGEIACDGASGVDCVVRFSAPLFVE